jgi:hypothetical protein
MKKKLNLELEALAVDSFDTSAAGDGHGTVHGQADLAPQPTPPVYADCTCAYSCVCKTAYYWCGDGYQTLHSCDYTYNGSCKYSDDDYSCMLTCTG